MQPSLLLRKLRGQVLFLDFIEMKRDRDDGAQYIEEKSETEKIVRNSPYGQAPRIAYGWGTPFKPCAKCTILQAPNNIHIGISSLNGVPGKAREMPVLLQQYMKKFSALEHCNPYHRMNDPPAWIHWKSMVEKRSDFVYTVKANQYLTHTKMLEMDEDTATHIDHFFRDLCPLLGSHLGPVLIQLPPSFRLTPGHLERLRAVAARIAPTGVRCAVEFRHRSWFCDEVYAALREVQWALVATHNEDVGETPLVDTGTHIMYVRLHGAVSRFAGDYGPVAMRRWAEACVAFVRSDPIANHVYFFLNNNESQVGGLTSSIVDATCLAETINALMAAGAPPPAPAAVAIGAPPAPTLPPAAPAAEAAVVTESSE
jgi:uncharacterized protein YecE (DUF72 family)